MEFLRYGENGIRVVFGKTIDPNINSKVINFYLLLRAKKPEGITNVIPSFNTCLLEFDDTRTRFEDIISTLNSMEDESFAPQESAFRIHEIPVRYGGDFGPDMGFVCGYTGLSEKEVIEVHTSVTYTVYTIGFIPGFPYLGTVDKRLFVPRLESPRTHVPAGSVGLAQLQTGIYTFESPGGWQIIGRTHMKLFDYSNPPYSTLQVGDKVRFVPV